MNDIMKELDQSTESGKLYRKNTPVSIFASIYIMLFLIFVGLVFAHFYEINDSKVLEGNILKGNKNNVYNAVVAIPDNLYLNIDFTKPIMCNLLGENGKILSFHGYIESLKKDGKGSVIGEAPLVFDYLGSKDIERIVKENAKSGCEVQLKSESLIDYFLREFF